MLNITKKIAIVASFVSLFLGQFEAFGSGSSSMEEGTEGMHASASPQPGSTVYIRYEVLKLILETASQQTHPANFRLACKDWKTIIDESKDEKKETAFDQQGSFMQKCMNIWWGDLKNGILRYTDPETKQYTDLPFFDILSNFTTSKGTFDLSAKSKYRNIRDCIRITLSVKEFLKVEEDNKSKVVTLLATRVMIESYINGENPFAEVLKNWPPTIPVGLFWRYSSEAQLVFDYLTTSSLSALSSMNLYQSFGRAWTCGFDGVCVEPHVGDLRSVSWEWVSCNADVCDVIFSSVL